MRRILLSMLTAAAAVIAAGNLLGRYRRDLLRAQRRIRADARMAVTAVGPIEYVMEGEGPSVLVIHGAGGGHDQGMLVARMIDGGFRWIAPSRFGYLQTPLPADCSAKAQAEAHGALIDALGIGDVSVVGVSAGAPSALTFAARYPERCRSVVLFSGLCREAPRRSPTQEMLFRYGLRVNAFYWILKNIMRSWVRSVVGASAETVARLSDVERAWLDEFLDSFLPIRPRYRGVIADMTMATMSDFLDLPLEEVRVPVLALQARDDNVLPFTMLQYLSEYIPHAQTIAFDTGGHLLLGHHAEVSSIVQDFLRNTAAPTG